MRTTGCNKSSNTHACVFVGEPYNTLFIELLEIIKIMTTVVHKDGWVRSYGVKFNVSIETNFLVDYEHAIIVTMWCGVTEMF